MGIAPGEGPVLRSEGRGEPQGIFPNPSEKTVMFLTAPEDRYSAAPSGLSDESRRRQSLIEEFSHAGKIPVHRDG